MPVRPARILILRGGALGDLIVTLPALRALRARWPDGRLELVGYPRVARLALAGGLVDEVHSLDQAQVAKFFAARPSFTEEQAAFVRSFDIVLSYLHDPQELLRENLRAAGARVLLTASPLVLAGHAVEHFLRPLQSLAIYEADPVPRLPVEVARADRARVLALHPGSGSARKNWPLDRFLALARRAQEIGWQPLFLLGEVEQGMAGPVAAAGFPLRVDLPLPEVAALLATCGAYVGNDSGISHLAAAVGCECVVLFGPTDSSQWAPRGRVAILPAPGGDLTALELDPVWTLVQSRLNPEP